MNTQEEEFNVALGHRLMVLRLKQKMSQGSLGAHLGMSGQQIHRYETGESRIPPEKLFRCAEIFSISIEYFFNEIPTAVPFDKSIMTIASEVHELPHDIRQSLYNLGCIINKNLENKDTNKSDYDDIKRIA